MLLSMFLSVVVVVVLWVTNAGKMMSPPLSRFFCCSLTPLNLDVVVKISAVVDLVVVVGRLLVIVVVAGVVVVTKAGMIGG